MPGALDPGLARQARHQDLGDEDPDAASWGRPGPRSPASRPHLERVPPDPGPTSSPGIGLGLRPGDRDRLVPRRTDRRAVPHRMAGRSYRPALRRARDLGGLPGSRVPRCDIGSARRQNLPTPQPTYRSGGTPTPGQQLANSRGAIVHTDGGFDLTEKAAPEDSRAPRIPAGRMPRSSRSRAPPASSRGPTHPSTSVAPFGQSEAVKWAAKTERSDGRRTPFGPVIHHPFVTPRHSRIGATSA
jgi:hypothetical protein